MDNSPKLRLFVEHALAEKAVLALDAGQSHYLLDVMRAKPGSPVALFNGRDGEWLGRLDRTGKRAASLTVEACLRPQKAEPDLWLLVAPIKRARFDWVVEKAVELGVSRILPVFTRHTVMSRVNDDRLSAIAVEAAEQCERLTVPEVALPQTLETLLAGWSDQRRLIVLDEGGGGRSIATALAELAAGPMAILVGPEGGFAKTELDGLRALSFATPVGLGPRILRADTAAIAALACVQALRGDWGEAPPPRPGSHSLLEDSPD